MTGSARSTALTICAEGLNGTSGQKQALEMNGYYVPLAC
jgi:hypothetical protein